MNLTLPEWRQIKHDVCRGQTVQKSLQWLKGGKVVLANGQGMGQKILKDLLLTG